MRTSGIWVGPDEKKRCEPCCENRELRKDMHIPAHVMLKTVRCDICGRDPHTINVFDDWWGMEVPPELIRLGFEDVAWHNDAAARMLHPVPDINGNVIEVWVGSDATVLELGEDHQYMVNYLNQDADETERKDAFELGLSFNTKDRRSFLAMVKAMMEAQAFELALHKAAGAIVS